jgi:hypothetical protein
VAVIAAAAAVRAGNFSAKLTVKIKVCDGFIRRRLLFLPLKRNIFALNTKLLRSKQFFFRSKRFSVAQPEFHARKLISVRSN